MGLATEPTAFTLTRPKPENAYTSITAGWDHHKAAISLFIVFWVPREEQNYPDPTFVAKRRWVQGLRKVLTEELRRHSFMTNPGAPNWV